MPNSSNKSLRVERLPDEPEEAFRARVAEIRGTIARTGSDTTADPVFEPDAATIYFKTEKPDITEPQIKSLPDNARKADLAYTPEQSWNRDVAKMVIDAAANLAASRLFPFARLGPIAKMGAEAGRTGIATGIGSGLAEAFMSGFPTLFGPPNKDVLPTVATEAGSSAMMDLLLSGLGLAGKTLFSRRLPSPKTLDDFTLAPGGGSVLPEGYSIPPVQEALTKLGIKLPPAAINPSAAGEALVYAPEEFTKMKESVKEMMSNLGSERFRGVPPTSLPQETRALAQVFEDIDFKGQFVRKSELEDKLKKSLKFLEIQGKNYTKYMKSQNITLTQQDPLYQAGTELLKKAALDPKFRTVAEEFMKNIKAFAAKNPDGSIVYNLTPARLDVLEATLPRSAAFRSLKSEIKKLQKQYAQPPATLVPTRGEFWSPAKLKAQLDQTEKNIEDFRAELDSLPENLPIKNPLKNILDNPGNPDPDLLASTFRSSAEIIDMMNYIDKNLKDPSTNATVKDHLRKGYAAWLYDKGFEVEKEKTPAFKASKILDFLGDANNLAAAEAMLGHDAVQDYITFLAAARAPELAGAIKPDRSYFDRTAGVGMRLAVSAWNSVARFLQAPTTTTQTAGAVVIHFREAGKKRYIQEFLTNPNFREDMLTAIQNRWQSPKGSNAVSRILKYMKLTGVPVIAVVTAPDGTPITEIDFSDTSKRGATP